MICKGCREPHSPTDCVDAKANREPPWRHCSCQHKPLSGTTAHDDEGEKIDG